MSTRSWKFWARQDPEPEDKETANGPSQKAQVKTSVLHRLYTLFCWMLWALNPLIIFACLKIFMFDVTLGESPLNANIPAAVGVVLYLHIVMVLYMLKLMKEKESAQPVKQDTPSAWVEHDHGYVKTMLLLIVYSLQVLCIPVLIFCVLKFTVFDILFPLSQKKADVLSTIGLVVAVHVALGFLIYSENKAGLSQQIQQRKKK